MVKDAVAQGSTAPFDLAAFFAGRTRGRGLFVDRFGRVRRRFDVEMTGQWHGDVFVLDEHFRYDTGEVEERTWRVSAQVEGRFSATSDDCIGTLRGTANADGVTMRYRFNLKLDARAVSVDFDDRIYRLGEGLAINRATMSKWGIILGELSLFFERMTPDPPGDRRVTVV